MKKLFLTLVLSISLFANAQKDSTKVDNFQKTDEVLSEVVKKALTIAEKTGDFVIEQAPLLLQEFYKWHICKAVFMALLFLGIFLLVQKLSRLLSYENEELIPKENKEYYYKKRDGRFYYSSYGDGDSESYAFSIGMKIASYFSFIGVAVWLYDLVFILVAPKLYLIEYFIK